MIGLAIFVTLPRTVSLSGVVLIWCLTPAWAQSQSQSGATAATPSPAAPIAPNAPEMSTKDAPAVFKTRVNMVMAPVVVRDAKGHTIATYTKENFQLFDKGKPQEIIRFSVEKSGGLAAKAAKTADAIPNLEGGPAPAPLDLPERFVVYLFDDMHLQFGDLVRARDAAGRQLAKLAKTDRAAIYTTSGQNQLDFTDDIDKLQATLLLIRNRSISNMGGIARCPDISYYMADMIVNKNDTTALNLAAQEAMACSPGMTMTAAVMEAQSYAQQVLGPGGQETRVAMAVLRDVVRRMATMPGQRIMVLISPGFLTPEVTQDKSDILDRAIKANVLINALDARGLWVDPMVDASRSGATATSSFMILKQQYDRDSANAQADVLGEMAYGTGGSFFHNNNDLDEGLRELVTAPESYYLLGFSPQNLKLDGSFHALKVTLKAAPNAGLNLQARKGYYAPKKLTDAAETAKQEIEEALFSRDELGDLPVELHTQYHKASDKEATIAVLCRIDPRHIQFRKADGRNDNVLTILSAVFDRDGNFLSGMQKTVDLKLKDQTLAKLMATGEMSFRTNFSVPPGTYMVRLVVRDSEGQLMSALNGAVAIQ